MNSAIRNPQSAIHVTACFAAALFLVGCTSGDPPPEEAAIAPAQSATSEHSPPKDSDPPVEVKPDPADIWQEVAGRIEQHFEADRLDEAQAALAELAAVYPAGESPSDEQQRQQTDLKKRLAGALKAEADRQRAQHLSDTEKFIEEGKYAEATRALGDVLAQSPSAEQEAQATAMMTEIERRRQARRHLQALKLQMGSEKRIDVRAAQRQLEAEPDTAAPLLLEWVQETGNLQLVENSLETMRRINRPAVTLPAMVAVLDRNEQKESWPAAVDQIVRAKEPGTGHDLLALATKTEDDEQRKFALEAVAQVVDPPRRTLLALLPQLMQDGPLLAELLRAAYHAVETHQQYDLLALRGFDVQLSPEEEQQIFNLSARLEAIVTAGKADSPSETAQAAQVLAVALRVIPPETLPVASIVSFSAESENGPAAAVLDGIWNAVEPETMWRYPAVEYQQHRGSMVLDLGQERTVMSVRIWNFNEPSGVQRGWKEVDIYVSNNPRELNPIASGLIPTAPGAAEMPDYSTKIPVNFARGRYVKIQAKSLWAVDSHTGLSEVEVIGF